MNQPPGVSPSPTQGSEKPPTRPEDVETGFWLWLIALPLLVINYAVDVAITENRSGLLIGASALVLVVVSTVVVTFLFLMRAGYRWARTLLTAGGIASIVSVSFGLFVTGRPSVGAVAFAVTGIIGIVLIGGGIYLLHRKDSHAFFTR